MSNCLVPFSFSEHYGTTNCFLLPISLINFIPFVFMYIVEDKAKVDRAVAGQWYFHITKKKNFVFCFCPFNALTHNCMMILMITWWWLSSWTNYSFWWLYFHICGYVYCFLSVWVPSDCVCACIVKINKTKNRADGPRGFRAVSIKELLVSSVWNGESSNLVTPIK